MARWQAVWIVAVLAAGPALGAQRDEFTKPVRLGYGDPAAVAPMMAPCLTLDWDRDGKDDLVGGGAWWRNTGQGREGLPLFAPGGTGGLGTTAVGDLDGDGFLDAVAASRDGYRWLEDTTQTGTRSFADRGPLAYVLGGDLPTPERGEGAPSCCLADWDGDGRTDLLAGTSAVGLERYLPAKGPGFGVGWREGTWVFRDMTATLYFHRNVGTKEKPLFTAGTLVAAGPLGRAITFFDQARPQVVDWDNDGSRDLVVCAFDRVVVFLNTAPAGQTPRLDDGHLVTFDGEATLPYERRSCFATGGAGGLWRLRFGGPTASEALQEIRSIPYREEGRARSRRDLFSFGPLRMIPFRGADLVLDTFAVPDAVDWDGDGKSDLVLGCEDGWVWLLRNLDPAGGVSRWAPPVRLEADGKPIRLDKNQCLQGPCEWLWGYSNPTVADWDLDGDLDLLCGSAAEAYVWFENTGTRKAPELEARGPLRCGEGAGAPLSCAWRTRPGVGDLDGDGLPDLVGVAGNLQLCWWRRERSPDGTLRLGAPAFPTDAAGKPFVVSSAGRGTGRSKLAVVDWDHDGRADVISSPPMGDRAGYLLFFRNAWAAAGRLSLELRPKQIRLSGHLAEGWNHFLMCEPVDLDGDGEWEVMAGVDRGALYYWKE